MAIARYVEGGMRPLEAALEGSRQIGFTIISLTISLIAVLIPLLFMGDVVGRLFHEFAITLAVTIVISAVVSLTLVPMMCAKLIRHHPDAERSSFGLGAEREQLVDQSPAPGFPENHCLRNARAELRSAPISSATSVNTSPAKRGRCCCERR